MNKSNMAIAVIGSLLLGGCVFAPSGDDGRYNRNPPLVEPTVGQELLDLDRALDAGVINQAEYERAKTRILEGRD